MSSRIFAIGDIHGEYKKFSRLFTLLEDAAGFSFARGDELVQLGDKCDRGPDTFLVMQRFKELKAAFPDQIHLIWGNHERLMWDSAQPLGSYLAPVGMPPWDAMEIWKRPGNGGKNTMESYAEQTKIYGPGGWGNSLLASGHWSFLREEHLMFLETEEYFFSHSPIMKDRHGETDWQLNEEILTWGHSRGRPEEEWITPHVIPGKISVHGHEHGIRPAKGPNTVRVFGKAEMISTVSKGEHPYFIPGARRVGDAILMDSGCGCHPEAPLSAIDLSTMLVYTSDGGAPFSLATPL